MSDFFQFAAAHGLAIRRLISDGQIHRCPTVTKPLTDNGAYMFDGSRGWCMDWAQGEEVQWWQDENAQPWTGAQKAEVAKRNEAALRERIERQRKAAQEAAKILAEAELVIPREGRAWKPGRPAVEPIYAHPYLVRKGFPLEPSLIAGDELLVPMFDCFDRTKPIGLQRIKPDGDKKFLIGQRAKRAVHRMGTGKARQVWLCEGYATSLTVRTAIKKMYGTADVVACFSAGNIIAVAQAGIGTHVFADRDVSGVGERAAQATGLPYAIAMEIGMDANDLFMRHGIDAVCDLMRERMT